MLPYVDQVFLHVSVFLFSEDAPYVPHQLCVNSELLSGVQLWHETSDTGCNCHTLITLAFTYQFSENEQKLLLLLEIESYIY